MIKKVDIKFYAKNVYGSEKMTTYIGSILDTLEEMLRSKNKNVFDFYKSELKELLDNFTYKKLKNKR